MNKAIYPGTFDPPTFGHLNIVERAAAQCDLLYIAIGENHQKERTFFSLEERVHFIESITKNITNVEVITFKGLLVDFAASLGVKILIRSIRSYADFEYETTQGQLNKQMGNIDTFYLMVDERYRLMSSTWAREIASHGKRLQGIIPNEIEEAVFSRLNNEY